MPKGKGTYGSKVGRPPKKAKGYQQGGAVEMKNPMVTNAMDRSQNIQGYGDGGKVSEKVSGGSVSRTGDSVQNIKRKGRGNEAEIAVEVKTPEGKRWYSGKGTGRRRSTALAKAKMAAKKKYTSSPADSLVTGGIRPDLQKKKK